MPVRACSEAVTAVLSPYPVYPLPLWEKWLKSPIYPLPPGQTGCWGAPCVRGEAPDFGDLSTLLKKLLAASRIKKRLNTD